MFSASPRLVFAFILFCLAGQPALAVPAPKSDAELMAQSDVVALVRVLSVTCTSIKKDEKTGEDLPGYLAKLEVVEVKKGDVKPGAVLLITWRALPKGIIGGWSVAYYPGEEVWTHLTKRSGGVTYGTTWWNAKGTPIKAPETTDLPPGIGQTSAMRGTP